MAYKEGTEKERIRIIEECKKDKAQLDLLHETWDRLFGIEPYDFEVYALTDGTRPEFLQFGPFLEFTHIPFYVGYGKAGKRVKESCGVGRQKDKYCFKTMRLIEIEEIRGGKVRPVIIGRFKTMEKAMLIERKLMNIIPRSYLTNSQLHYCAIPLKAEDCNVIYNRVVSTKLLKF